MSSVWPEIRRGLRLRRRRTLLTAVGIALAAAMLSTAIVLADDLGGGFDRAARAADLPDAIVRFDPQARQRVAARVRALPDVAAFSTRSEFTNVHIAAHGHRSGRGSAEVVGPGRRGYAIVAGRDVSSRWGEVVVERGVAQSWHLALGDTLEVGGVGPQRIVGFAEAPDDVGYPLGVPRFYMSRAAVNARFGADPDQDVDVAEIWLRDPSRLNEVLVQARTSSYGLRGVRLITRSGVRVLLDQAAGIVIDLIVALSLFALATAAVMLAASARAEIQRRLHAIGVSRAIGASRGHLVMVQAAEAAAIAVPAATVGVVAGLLAASGPSGRLLTMLNEPPAGAALAGPLLAAWGLSVAIPVAAAAWPAARAAGRPPVALLQGAGLAATSRPRRPPRVRGRRAAGLTALGARLVAARRARLAATVLTLGTSAAFVLLLLALAAALNTLETDPGALGKRYRLTASLPAEQTPAVRAVPGVQAAAARYEVQALDSFSLGETIDVIAYPGDHTIFEAPPLVGGHRLSGSHQAEVGAGLADALGLSPDSVLAIALPSGAELRLRVAGVVGSLDHDGRVAYIPASALLRVDPAAPEQIAVRLDAGADPSRVSSALAALGAAPAPAGGATARGVPLVQTLRAILVAIAIVDGLVCLYALIQTCALTLAERRRTLAVLRATGAGAAAVRRLLTGVVFGLVAPAAVLGVIVERIVLGPAMSSLAAGYATLELGAGYAQILAVLAGLVVAGAVSVLWVTRLATREVVVVGLAAT